MKSFVGKNQKNNWALLDSMKDESGLFFHLSYLPSCYVFLLEPYSESDILECAVLCKNKTKFRDVKKVYVDYTEIGNVRKGDKEGEVEYISLRKLKKLRV